MLLAAALVVSATLLEPGTTATRNVRGGESQAFRVNQPADRVVRIVINQGESDLRAIVSGPGGEIVGEFDQLEWGREPVVFRTTVAGDYQLTVTPVRAVRTRASFEVRFLAADAPTERDDRVMAALRSGREAKALSAPSDSGQRAAAMARRREALGLWREGGDPAGEAETQLAIGDLLYRTGEIPAAIEAYRDGLAIALPLGDRRLEVGLHANFTAALWAAGDVVEALRESTLALEQTHALGLTIGEATTLTNRGVLLWQTGDFDAALQDHSRARAIFRANGDRRSEAYALVNWAVVLETLGQPSSALRRLDQALTLFRAVGDQVSEAQALLRRARVQLTLRRLQSARISVQRSLALQTGHPDRPAEADARLMLGDVLTASGDATGARGEYEHALALFRTLGNRRGESSVLHGIGVSYLQARDPERARDWLEQAVALRLSLGLTTLQAESLAQLAAAARMSGDLSRAREAVLDAIRLVQSSRATIFERELRTSYTDAIHRHYLEAVNVLFEMHRRWPDEGYDARALELIERARSRDLVETALASPVRPGDEAVLREKRLRQELNYWSWQLWQATGRSSTGDDGALKARVARLIEQQAAAEADVRRVSAPAVLSSQDDAASVSEFQRELLDPSTVLLEYALGETRSVLWIVTDGTLELVELPPRRTIEALAERLARIVAADPTVPTVPSAGTSRQAEEVGRLASQLGRMVLAPAGAALASHRRVIIAADGALHYVPFAALALSAHGKPLIESHELAMVPSATVASLIHRRKAGAVPARKVLAMFADPVFDERDARVRRAVPAQAVSTGSAPGRRMARLPFSRDEATRIVSLVPPVQRSTWLDFAANREVVTGTALADYRYVHFATHAVRDDREPGLSSIVLSLVDQEGRPRDGFVRLHDIYAMRLNSELVVLSACETAVGRRAEGEGLLSLARGFFAAGATRVLATLWKVDDEATAVAMESFYKALLGGASPGKALRDAQNTLRRSPRWSHPYFWSGFVLQGAL